MIKSITMIGLHGLGLYYGPTVYYILVMSSKFQKYSRQVAQTLHVTEFVLWYHAFVSQAIIETMVFPSICHCCTGQHLFFEKHKNKYLHINNTQIYKIQNWTYWPLYTDFCFTFPGDILKVAHILPQVYENTWELPWRSRCWKGV